MRTREEIEASIKGEFSFEMANLKHLNAILELLLDIRDLLSDQKKEGDSSN